MREIRRIEDQLKRAFEKHAWHGPSVREVLSGVTAHRAAARPIANGHSIWEIACHVSTWQRVVRQRLIEKKPVEPSDEENFPTIHDTRAAAWKRTLRELEEGQKALRQTILTLNDRQLDDPVRGMDYSVYVMLHGVIQHNLYHAGQIALLKKA